jgi:hypothetical protein
MKKRKFGDMGEIILELSESARIGMEILEVE